MKTIIEQKDGWSEWIYPSKRGYKMQCCDCGLVHDLKFKVVSEKHDRSGTYWTAVDAPTQYRTAFKAKRKS